MIYGCAGSSLTHTSFVWLWRAGAPLHCSVHASHCAGFSCWGAGLPGCVGFSTWGTWAQWLQLPGSVAPHLVGSSRTRDRTLVSCIGRLILNYWTARKVHLHHFYYSLSLETEHKECNVNLCLMAQANFKVNTSLSCDIVVSFGASAMEWSLQSLNEKA